jgi:fucose 4-O-acetylase-like acetyltransferase
MLKREPAVIIAALAAIVQGVAIIFTGDPSTQTDWATPILTALVTMLAGLWTRRRVFSENTVREAGYTPAELVARANSPHIRTAEEE